MNHRVPRDPRQNEFHHRRLLIPGAAFFFDNALACHKYDSHKIRPVTFHGFSPCPIAAGLQGLEIGNSSLRVATTAHNDPYLGINLRANSSGFDFSLSFFFFSRTFVDHFTPLPGTCRARFSKCLHLKRGSFNPPSDNLNPSYFYRNWTLSLSFVQS